MARKLPEGLPHTEETDIAYHANVEALRQKLSNLGVAVTSEWEVQIKDMAIQQTLSPHNPFDTVPEVPSESALPQNEEGLFSSIYNKIFRW